MLRRVLERGPHDPVATGAREDPGRDREIRTGRVGEAGELGRVSPAPHAPAPAGPSIRRRRTVPRCSV